MMTGKLLEGPMACVHASSRISQPDFVHPNFISSAFSKVPNEILLHIFRLHVQQDIARKPIHQLVAVCKHWRELSILTPSLWVFIAVRGGSKWLDLCLQRSGRCAVDIYFRSQHSYATTDQLKTLDINRARIRTLVLPPLHPSARSDVIELFGPPWPALEVLRLHGVCAETKFMPTLLIDGNSERYPRIRELSLTRVEPCDGENYPYLCGLSSAEWLESDLTFPEFMNLLSHASSLEKLDLDYTISSLRSRPDRWDPPDEHQEPTMVLPRLVELNILDCRSGDIADFLSQFSLPRVEHITFEYEEKSQGLHWQGCLSESLVDFFPHRALSTVCCLPVLARTTHVRATAWEDEYAICAHASRPQDDRERGLAHLSLNVGHNWNDDGVYAVLDDLVGIFGGIQIRSVLFEGGFRDYNDTEASMVKQWQTVFLAFPLLETIELVGHGSSTIFWLALRTASKCSGSDPDADDDAVHACPVLRTVVYGEGADDVDEEFFEEMVSCLRYRTERGSRLETLKLCTVDLDSFEEIYLPQLETLVNSVEYELEESDWSEPSRGTESQ